MTPAAVDEGAAAGRAAAGQGLRAAFRERWPYLLAGLAALPAGYRLLAPGFWVSGDGLHHLYRVAALADYLREGVLYPRWVGDFAFGYGVPVFNFYSPLSYYLAQLFAWLGPLWALKLAMLGGLVASSVLMYHFAAAHTGRWPALAAALVYTYAPYRFVDLYPRAALAEHMAFLWLPLILWAYDGACTGACTESGAGRRRAWQVAGWSGLVLTHSFTALMFAPFFLLYVLGNTWPRREWRALAWAAGTAGLAIGLTAFFWLPLALETRYAGLSMDAVSAGYRNHLVAPLDLLGRLVYDYGTGGGRPDYYYAFGLVPLLLAAVSLVAAARRDAPRLARFGAAACLLGLLMVSRLSGPAWDAFAPLLAKMQFPWRFLAIATFGLALAVTGAVRLLPSARWQAAGAGVIAAALLVTGLWGLPREALSQAAADVTPESLWAFDRQTGQAGTTWGGEFLPIWVQEQRWALGRGPESPKDGQAMQPVNVAGLKRAGDTISFDVRSASDWTLRLHTYFFPGWQVRLDGRSLPTAASGPLGLVTATIPAGGGRVSAGFEETAPRTAGRWLSAVALALLPAAAWWPLRRRGSQLALAGWAAAVLAGVFLIAPALPQQVVLRPAQGVFGDRAQLVGAEAPGRVRGGERVPVELYWLSLRENALEDKAFVHLVDAAGKVVAQHDGGPGGGFTPTTRWQQGELVPDRHYLDLPADLAPGVYRIKAGLYQFDPFRNLLTEPADPAGRVDLGEILVQ